MTLSCWQSFYVAVPDKLRLAFSIYFYFITEVLIRGNLSYFVIVQHNAIAHFRVCHAFSFR